MGGDDSANYTSLATTPSVVTPVPALGGGGGVGREHTVYCQVPVGLGMGEAGLYNHIVHSNRRGP